MLASNIGDINWSEKKMEGDDNLRTLECLRGRLLAERVASRVAKEDAELMGNKLIELENQLRLEIKSKNRVEKKLKFFMKKLESLKITYVLEESEQYSSSENCEISCRSSSTSSGTKDPEDQEPNSQITNTEKWNIEEVMKETNSPIISQNLKHIVSETTISNQSHSSEEISSSPATAISDSNCNCKDASLESSRSSEDSKTDDHSSSSSNFSMGGMEINGEKEDYVDNSLALVLVPASLQAPPSQNGELKMVSGSVSDVLDALRHAREKLQSSMERRHMIKFGSIDTKIC